MSEWVWSPAVVHEPVISLNEWKQAQEVTAALRAGPQNIEYLLHILAAARRLSMPFAAITSGETHVVYQIRDRRVVLPTRFPEVHLAGLLQHRRQPGSGGELVSAGESGEITCLGQELGGQYGPHPRHAGDGGRVRVAVEIVPGGVRCRARVYGHGRTLKLLIANISDGLAHVDDSGQVTVVAVTPELDELRDAEVPYMDAQCEAVVSLALRSTTARDIVQATEASAKHVNAFLAELSGPPRPLETRHPGSDR